MLRSDNTYDYQSEYENFTFPDYFPDDNEMFQWISLIDSIGKVLGEVNNILSIICLVINLAHFLVMIQKKMRTSSIIILTIGISICDIVVIGNTVGTLIYNMLSSNICWPQFTYLSRLFKIISLFSEDSLFRLAPWLGLAMAFIRALFLLFPWSRRIKTLSEKRLAIPIILVFFTISSFISALVFSRYSIFDYDTWVPVEICGYPPGYTQPMFTIQVGRKIILSYKTAMEIYAAVNGAASIIPAVTYPLIAVVLVVKLLKMKKGRSKLFSTRDAAEKDHTTTLVILMTITFSISQLPVGIFMWLRLIYPFHYVLYIALDHGAKFTSILFTINATCHCFIFATLCSQYREVVREVFCCRNRKNVSGA
ncbi:hypothetical protein CRE_23487 [Caenorhabditis remanei]|uniref:G-protein coupled receptors family 1 profile domain-containing protein n=1 Tax=Caenorhabditis remanei TaxID=31234 RepID=E3MGZ9_CAERE|nr:hypothetical protein CRE_23487 [Caenorhabditis remanei]